MLDTITFDQLPKAVGDILDGIAEIKDICKALRGDNAAKDEFLTIEHLQAYHPDHPSLQTVHRWKSLGYIPYYKDPATRRVKFKKSEIGVISFTGEVFSNLFLYVTASASAGKGRLSLCRHLAAPLHRELREQYRKSMEKYKQEQLQYVMNKKKGEASEPEEPPFLTLFIPANSTATAVYQTLSQNNGVGLLFETEGDTLANAFNSDLGNYLDGFRKAFHHEMISYLRKRLWIGGACQRDGFSWRRCASIIGFSDNDGIGF